MKDNKLIAEFMGYRVFNKGTKCYSPKYNDGTIAPMQFHTSWDWLMPVVKKIDDMLLLDDDEVNDAVNRVHNAVLLFDIDNTYDAVVEFIKEYNDGCHQTYNDRYPFNEGDDYWVVEDGDLVWGVWDDISEEIHDESPDRIYFTEEEAIDYARKNGIKYK